MKLTGNDFPRPVKTYHTQTYSRISPKTSGFKGAGKTVLVTGGAAGVGFSVSRAFAEAGVAKVVLVGRSPGTLKEAKQELDRDYPKTNIETVQISIDDLDAVSNAMQSAGPIDVLVLNAVFTHAHGVPSKDISAADVEQTFRTNVIAAYHMLTTYLKSPMPAGGERTVLSVSSASAQLYVPQQAAYGASKAAFSRIISALADEHSPDKDGVRLISFHPGILYTPSAAKLYSKDAADWEDINLPGDFAVWLAGSEASLLHGRFVWAQWDVDELIQLKEKIEADPSYLKLGLVY